MGEKKILCPLKKRHTRMVHCASKDEVFYGCCGDDNLRALLVAARIRHRDAHSISAWEAKGRAGHWNVKRYHRLNGVVVFDTLFKDDAALDPVSR